MKPDLVAHLLQWIPPTTELTDYRSSVSPKDRDDSLLQFACREGTHTSVEILLENGAPVDYAKPLIRHTAMIIAIRQQHAASVCMLCSRRSQIWP